MFASFLAHGRWPGRSDSGFPWVWAYKKRTRPGGVSAYGGLRFEVLPYASIRCPVRTGSMFSCYPAVAGTQCKAVGLLGIQLACPLAFQPAFPSPPLSLGLVRVHTAKGVWPPWGLFTVTAVVGAFTRFHASWACPPSRAAKL